MPPILPNRLTDIRRFSETGSGDLDAPFDIEGLLVDLASISPLIRVEWREELIVAVRRWIADQNAPNIRAYKTYLKTDDWAVQTVVSDGRELGAILHVPTESESRAPSAGEETIVAALLYCEQADFVDLRISAGQVIAHWRDENLQPHVAAVIASATGALVRSESAYEIATSRASQIDVAASLLTKSEADAKFLAEAYRLIALAGEVRWQFLGFYRVFEHAWLRTIHAQLTKAFLASPMEALKSAEEALASERMKFEETVDLLGVRAEFADFNSEFQALLAANNRFSHAINRIIDKNAGIDGGWRIGVRACYQIRCAVVHSGEMGPYHESFEDADGAIIRLLVHLERAMNKMIGFAVA